MLALGRFLPRCSKLYLTSPVSRQIVDSQLSHLLRRFQLLLQVLLREETSHIIEQKLIHATTFDGELEDTVYPRRILFDIKEVLARLPNGRPSVGIGAQVLDVLQLDQGAEDHGEGFDLVLVTALGTGTCREKLGI